MNKTPKDKENLIYGPNQLEREPLDVLSGSFWSQLKIDPNKAGDKDVADIYKAVGKTLSVWERVEESLSILFLTFSETEGTKHANFLIRLFGCIENSNGRLKALEVAAELFFREKWSNKKVRKDLTDLTQGVRFASWRRNEIAHGIAQNITVSYEGYPESDEERTVSNNGAFLYAPEYMTARNYLAHIPNPKDPGSMVASKYRYNSSDIYEYMNKFYDLIYKIETYRSEIPNRDKFLF